MLDRQSHSPDTMTEADSEAPCSERDDAATDRSPTPGKIGFVGLGRMGAAMAANLAAAGYHVVGYVRRQELMDKVQGRGVIPTMDVSELFDCEIAVCMLPDDDAVR